MGIYFKLAPGVRVRLTSHGVRTAVGPRAARVHVGGGYRSGISTGAGPLTLYQSVGASRRRRARTTSVGHSRTATAASVVDWSSASAAEIIQRTGRDLSTQLTGRTRHLEPLDLATEPDLGALLGAVDVDAHPGADR